MTRLLVFESKGAYYAAYPSKKKCMNDLLRLGARPVFTLRNNNNDIDDLENLAKKKAREMNISYVINLDN